MKQDAWDRLGISVSGICLVHCLLLPVVISVLPIWTSAQQVHGWLHPVFAALLVPTTILALIIGFRRHHSHVVVGLMVVGLLLVVGAAIPAFHNPGIAFETVLTMTGSAFLISGHVLNWKQSKTCKMPGGATVPATVAATMSSRSDLGHSIEVDVEGHNATS